MSSSSISVFLIQLHHFLGENIQADDFVVLVGQDAVGQTNVASTDDGDFHSTLTFTR